MLFSAQRKPTSEAASKLGCRSMFVLAKLGFDMRDQYQDLLSEPLPVEFSRALALLEDRERA